MLQLLLLLNCSNLLSTINTMCEKFTTYLSYITSVFFMGSKGSLSLTDFDMTLSLADDWGRSSRSILREKND